MTSLGPPQPPPTADDLALVLKMITHLGAQITALGHASQAQTALMAGLSRRIEAVERLLEAPGLLSREAVDKLQAELGAAQMVERALTDPPPPGEPEPPGPEPPGSLDR